jgi:hypothetical protein
MRKQILASFALATLSLNLISCGDGKTSSNFADKVSDAASSVTESEQGGFFKSKERLAKAQQSLLDMPKFKGKKVFVFQSAHFFDDGRITLELQNPDKPTNIDHYEYKDGGWSEPTPVQISGDGDMKDNLTPMDDIKFDVVATVYNNWNEKAKAVEGAKPLDHVYFSLWVPNQDRYWNSSSIEGTREKYNITFNLDGSVKKFEKS